MSRHAVQLSYRSVLDLRLLIVDCRFEFGNRNEGEQAQTMPDEGLKRKADFSKPWKIRTL
jgi:hypothetical protein